MITNADTIQDDGFGKGLQQFALSESAKIEFLLRSVPAFYANTIENIRSKEYQDYDTVARKLKEYIKPKNPKKKNGSRNSVDDPIVLKTTIEDNGKRYQYCIKVKKWKGLNHTEDECRTKKRDRERKQDAKKAEDENQGSNKEFVKMTTIDPTDLYK